MTLSESARITQAQWSHLDRLEPLNFWLHDRRYCGVSRMRVLECAHAHGSLDSVADDRTLDPEDVDTAREILARCLLPEDQQSVAWADYLETTDASDFAGFRAIVHDLID